MCIQKTTKILRWIWNVCSFTINTQIMSTESQSLAAPHRMSFSKISVIWTISQSQTASKGFQVNSQGALGSKKIYDFLFWMHVKLLEKQFPVEVQTVMVFAHSFNMVKIALTYQWRPNHAKIWATFICYCSINEIWRRVLEFCRLPTDVVLVLHLAILRRANYFQRFLFQIFITNID